MHVSIANHKYHSGEYKMDTYLTGGNGMVTQMNGPRTNMKPVQAKIDVKDIDGTEREYQLNVTNAGVFGNLRQVTFAVWSAENGQDDIKWINGTSGANGSWSSKAIINQFKSYGTYNVHIYGTLENGTSVFMGNTTFEVSKPTWEIEVTNKDEEAGTFDIVIKNIDSKSGVRQIQVPVWCEGASKDVYWYTAQKQNDGTYKVHVSIANHKYHSGEYKMDTYLTDGNGFTVLIAGDNFNFAPKTSIIGDSKITVSQMVNWFNQNNSNFDKFTKYSNGEYDGIYKEAGIDSIEEFCQIYYEEASAEGIKVEVAFSQAMLETGFLKFGGQVKPSQFNFAGLGATDNGASGASFSSVREGIRAQIQHLKCYASTEPLVNDCVDPRWNESLRGKAIYVEYLSIPNNPYKVGWATDKGYSSNILNYMNILLNTESNH